jgi:PHP family Zn ribbon phosphoesterase
MRIAVDLHIHSALSPCSDNDMTPNNVLNMAILKGLDIIAITDHNSAENVEAILQCAKDKDIVVIPGMEIETREEIHVVCLFPNLETALKMQHIVYEALPDLENREDIFGQQLIMDKDDNTKGCVDRLLLTAASLSLEDVHKAALDMGGVMIPAHVDRESYSILSNLGMVPECLGLKYLEISRRCDLGKLMEEMDELEKYRFIRSSDAHALADIYERESFIEVEEKSIKGLLRELVP